MLLAHSELKPSKEAHEIHDYMESFDLLYHIIQCSVCEDGWNFPQVLYTRNTYASTKQLLCPTATRNAT